MRDKVVFLRRCVRSILCAVCLLLCGCFEGFEQLITSVRYDPFEQTFEVERRLVNIGERFFACGEDVDCPARVLDILNGEPSGEAAYAPAAQLRDRLMETGAEDVAYEMAVTDRGLDIVVTYRARLGTRAAEETRVHVEHEGRGGGGRYRLVVDAQDRMTMDRRSHRTRRRAQGGSGLLTWREEWVLRPGARDVVLRTPVASSIRSVLTHTGVAGVLADYGVPSSTSALRATVKDTVAQVVPEPQPELNDAAVEAPVSETPAPAVALNNDAPEVPAAPPELESAEEARTPSTPSPAVAVIDAPAEPSTTEVAVWDVLGFDGQTLPAVDPKGSAMTYVHEVQVVGAPLPESWSQQLALLGARSERCYQLRFDQENLTEGHAFLEISLADGQVTGTAVYGQMDDAELMRCLREGLESWVPPVVERHTQGTRWTLPVTFRIEKQRRRRR